MSKSSNPYGLSLFEYKGSNFSGTLAQYPLSPTGVVVDNKIIKTLPSTYYPEDKTGLAAKVTGIYTGDLVTFAPSSAGKIEGGTSYIMPGASLGYLVLANSLLPSDTGGTSPQNAPRPILGVFQGVQYQPANGQMTRSLSFAQGTTVAPNTTALATVNDLADCIFQVQCNAQLGSTVAAAMASIGNLYGFVNNGGGNASNGQSKLALDVASKVITTFVTSDAQFSSFRLIGLAPIQGNSWTDPYPDVLVMINSHMWKPGQRS